MALEGTVKGGVIAVAAVLGNNGDALLGPPEQSFCFFDSHMVNIVIDGAAQDILAKAVQSAAAHSQGSADIFHTDVFSIMFVHIAA